MIGMNTPRGHYPAHGQIQQMDFREWQTRTASRLRIGVRAAAQQPRSAREWASNRRTPRWMVRMSRNCRGCCGMLEHFIDAAVIAFKTAAKPGGQLHQVVVDLIRAQASAGGPANRKTIDTGTVCELWQRPSDAFFRFSDPQLLRREQFLRETQRPLEQVGHALLQRWSRAAIPAGSKHFAQIMRWLHLETVDRLGERGFSIRAMLTRVAQQPVTAYLADLPPAGGIE